jgi:hypothetical protein
MWSVTFGRELQMKRFGGKRRCRIVKRQIALRRLKRRS